MAILLLPESLGACVRNHGQMNIPRVIPRPLWPARDAPPNFASSPSLSSPRPPTTGPDPLRRRPQEGSRPRRLSLLRHRVFAGSLPRDREREGLGGGGLVPSSIDGPIWCLALSRSLSLSLSLSLLATCPRTCPRAPSQSVG